jgi:hypothetical protein
MKRVFLRLLVYIIFTLTVEFLLGVSNGASMLQFEQYTPLQWGLQCLIILVLFFLSVVHHEPKSLTTKKLI